MFCECGPWTAVAGGPGFPEIHSTLSSLSASAAKCLIIELLTEGETEKGVIFFNRLIDFSARC